MLQLSNTILNKAVLSLRTNAPVAKITSAIINPDNLKIEGFFCEDHYSKRQLVLLSQDIRDVMGKGYVINDHEVLSEPEELVRLKKTLQINFTLIGKHVETIDKVKVGKVSDYAADTKTMYIQKIYVAQSILKSFTGGSLSIDRNQINEITPKRIIINELTKRSRAVSPATAPIG
jgi:sporulation protein YlmC with PRC-barrel domain